MFNEIEDTVDNDELYQSAVDLVRNTRRVSISFIQRQLQLGYNRAARLVEAMEAKEVISKMDSNGSRTVL